MTQPLTILQIVPHLPGTLDGVGDYALRLARVLLRDHGVNTIFVVAEKTSVPQVGGFTVISGLHGNERPVWNNEPINGAILHYVNYGYHPRGIPFQLRKFARQLRALVPGRWITMFHELYASGPPWESAFWLRPLQVRIARTVIELSDVCFVSNEVIRKEILRHFPASRVRMVPVMSNFGEPDIVDAGTNLQNWAICGGASVIVRSLRSFAEKQQKIPKPFFPVQLEIIGGRDNDVVRGEIEHLAQLIPGLNCNYHPEVDSERASELLGRCTFGWIDYFGDQKPWPGMILKSGSFAAFCAHGVIPVSAYAESPPSVDGDTFPGWYFVTSEKSSFPPVLQVIEVRQRIQDWYRKHASSVKTAAAYAEALA